VGGNREGKGGIGPRDKTTKLTLGAQKNKKGAPKRPGALKSIRGTQPCYSKTARSKREGWRRKTRQEPGGNG